MMTCGYAQGTTLRHAHPRAIVLNSVDSLTFNASHFSYTPSHSNSAPRPWISQPTNRTPDGAHHTPHTTRQREDCPSRTLPNNVARNSPRSFFDYVSKRCNSNAANSKFEIVSRELRATLIEGPAVEGHEDYSSDGPDQHDTPHTTNRALHTAHHAPHTAHQREDCPSHSETTGPYRIMSHVIPHGHFSTTPQNVAIPTLRIQSLK